MHATTSGHTYDCPPIPHYCPPATTLAGADIHGADDHRCAIENPTCPLPAEYEAILDAEAAARAAEDRRMARRVRVIITIGNEYGSITSPTGVTRRFIRTVIERNDPELWATLRALRVPTDGRSYTRTVTVGTMYDLATLCYA